MNKRKRKQVFLTEIGVGDGRNGDNRFKFGFAGYDADHFGMFTHEQKYLIHDEVKGKVVYDIGSCEMVLSGVLLDMSASRVVAVDFYGHSKHERLPDLNEVFTQDPRFSVVRNGCSELMCEREKHVSKEHVLFLSWPFTRVSNDLLDFIEAHLARGGVMILACENNFDCACGNRKLFKLLAEADVKAESVCNGNTVTVYQGKEKLLRAEYEMSIPDEEPIVYGRPMCYGEYAFRMTRDSRNANGFSTFPARLDSYVSYLSGEMTVDAFAAKVKSISAWAKDSGF